MNLVIKFTQQSLQTTIDDIRDAIGPCQTIKNVSISIPNITTNFYSQTGDYATIIFSLDWTGLLSSLVITGVNFPSVVVKTWSDAVTYASKINGDVSITIYSDNYTKNSVNLQGDVTHPLGSAFKLYILGQLVDMSKTDTQFWTKTIPIQDTLKSLPTGIMQNYPNGQLYSIKEFASNMIKISDNTATDHLLQYAGRTKVESQLTIMSNSNVSLNQPFLFTSEMFKIKWASTIAQIQQYINSSIADKRTMLTDVISPIPLSQVGSNGLSLTTPNYINDIEWFGTTNCLCKAMMSLKNKGSQEALDILGLNTPNLVVGSTSIWEYGGYKGGSEPGVFTMTYILKSKNNEWGCVSIAVRNTTKNISTLLIINFSKLLLKLSESIITNGNVVIAGAKILNIFDNLLLFALLVSLLI